MINRLLGIVYILLKKGTMTAGELAERFEVSIRTIYRDIENLSMAGIPVYARKGRNGGISLTDRFVLDKLLISSEEQQWILAALAGMDETGAQKEEEILHKLGDFFHVEPINWVSIDFSDWSGKRQELFAQIKEAVLGRHVMVFDYYGQNGVMSNRTVEPVKLLFKEYTWYLWAFCRVRQDMRLFKVLRMKRVEVLEETFEPKRNLWVEQEGDLERLNTIEETKGVQETDYPEVIFRVDKKETYRIYDRFDEEEITVLSSGDFEICLRCHVDDWVYGLILSFGTSAKVLEPEYVRKEMAMRVRRMAELYADGQ